MSLREATEAVLLLQALTITQAIACLQGLLHKKHVFQRTNKFWPATVAATSTIREITQVVQELILGGICILLGTTALVTMEGVLEKLLPAFVLYWLSLPYLSVVPILMWNQESCRQQQVTHRLTDK